MITGSAISITGYSPEYQPSIRKILTKISWAEQYIVGMENVVDVFARDPETYGVYLDGVTYKKFFDR